MERITRMDLEFWNIISQIRVVVWMGSEATVTLDCLVLQRNLSGNIRPGE